MSGRFTLLAVLGACATIWAQKPVVDPGGVVNGAGFVAASQPLHGLAPGSIAAMFGYNLAASTLSASSYPLPTTLGGTTVTVDGTPVPLFYVSPGQVDFQVPSSAPFSYTGYAQISVVVTTAAGSSDPVAADVMMLNPMIFTVDGSGCGRGAVLNVASDGRTSLNSTSNSVSPGDYIEIYGTGLGPAYHVGPDGTPAPSNPLPYSEYAAAAFFEGENIFTQMTQSPFADASYAGRAPGLVGVDQVNVVVPMDVRQGCAVPLTISAPSVYISIHSGGGQCADPPIGSAGVLTLMKSTVVNGTLPPESDTFTGSFSASPGKTLPPPISIPWGLGDSPEGPVPVCPIPGYSTPDAGVITLVGPNLPSTAISPTTLAASASYSATLPGGSIGTGTYQVAAAGGNGVGAFQAAIAIGPDITITSQFPQGQIPGEGPLVVNWTGGGPGEAVTVKVVQHTFPMDTVNLLIVPASAGTVTFDQSVYRFLNNISTEIDVQVGPDPSQPQMFTATGLTLGGQIDWILEHRFINVYF